MMFIFFRSFDEVKGFLQQHLLEIEGSNILEKTDKTELYLLYINCLEVHLVLYGFYCLLCTHMK